MLMRRSFPRTIPPPPTGVTLTYTGGDACPSWANGGARTLKLWLACYNDQGSLPKDEVVLESGTCRYDIFVQTAYGCPSECPLVPTGTGTVNLCARHGVCDFDREVGRSRCFCNDGWTGGDCSTPAAAAATGLSAVGAVLLTVGLLLVATLGFLCVGMVWCGWGVGDAFGGEASGRGEGACAQCARAPAVCLQRPPLWLLEGGAQRARCGCGCGCPRRRRPAAATTRKGRRKRARKGRRPGCTHARTRRGDAYPLRRDACRIEPPTLRATSCVGARPAPSRPNARAYDHVRPHIRSVYLWNRIRGLRLDPSAYSSLRGAWRGGEGRG